MVKTATGLIPTMCFASINQVLFSRLGEVTISRATRATSRDVPSKSGNYPTHALRVNFAFTANNLVHNGGLAFLWLLAKIRAIV